MADYTLLVEFVTTAGCEQRFLSLVEECARYSVESEPDCLRFDVIQDDELNTRVLLYEVFSDKSAFEVHRQLPHVFAFWAAAKDIIVSREVRQLSRTASYGRAS